MGRIGPLEIILIVLIILGPVIVGIVLLIHFNTKKYNQGNPRTCRQCGYSVPEGTKFCPQCGKNTEV